MVLPGTVVEEGTVVEYAILGGDGCHIGKNSRIGSMAEGLAPANLTVVAPGCCLAEGTQVAPGIMLGSNGEEVSR